MTVTAILVNDVHISLKGHFREWTIYREPCSINSIIAGMQQVRDWFSYEHNDKRMDVTRKMIGNSIHNGQGENVYVSLLFGFSACGVDKVFLFLDMSAG